MVSGVCLQGYAYHFVYLQPGRFRFFGVCVLLITIKLSGISGNPGILIDSA
ncbi:hypothetical protein B595_0709 [Chlamydia psittaci 84/55]|nr:hypothetical protein B595_0709 [Chlamydia psittaci 84/55]